MDSEATGGVARAYRILAGSLALWDLSLLPTTNDKDAKLGNGGVTGGGTAVLEVSSETSLARTHDGYEPTHLSVFRPLNPNNWVLRFDSENGQEYTATWDARLVVEHKNPAKERKHASTMWIDDCAQQTWAWSQDLFWIKDLAANVVDHELDFNGAGFLSMLYPDDDPGIASGTRGCLMLNAARNGGWTTDGNLAAPLQHVVHLYGGAGGGTTTSSSGGTDTCSEVSTTTLGLPGDVNFHVGAARCHLAIGAGALTDGDPAAGWLWVGPPMRVGPATQHSLDVSSNQPEQARPSENALRTIVLVPKRWEPIRPPGGMGLDMAVPNNFPGQPGGGPTTPPNPSMNGAANTDVFPTGVVTGYAAVMQIPESVPDGYGLDVAANFATPAGGVGANAYNLQLDYCAVALGGAVNPGAVTESLTATVPVATYPGRDSDERVFFRVDGSKLRGKEGGKLLFAFYRRGDTDTNANDLHVLGLFAHFGVVTTRVS